MKAALAENICRFFCRRVTDIELTFTNPHLLALYANLLMKCWVMWVAAISSFRKRSMCYWIKKPGR